MYKRYITIAAGIALAASFFIPWLRTFMGNISPWAVFQELHQFGIKLDLRSLVFIGTFVLGGVVAVRTGMGRADRFLLLAAGAAPLACLLYAIVQSGATSNNLGMLTQGAGLGIGLVLHYGGAVALVIVGVLSLRIDDANLASNEPVDIAD